jgi:large conductance mechanosensitive channel
MKGFRGFVLRGNVVDLAVGIVIGAAFGTVVAALVKDLVTPLVAALFGKQDFSALYFSVNNSKFLYGDFLNAVLAFLLIALVVYYFIVLPYTGFRARYAKGPAADPPTTECPECLSSIPQGARRCMYCTSEQPAPA